MFDSAMRNDRVVAVSTLTEFFRDSVHSAVERQKVELDGHTEHYVVNLLTMFARSEALYDRTPEGIRLRPLAHMFAEAAEAPPGEQRNRALQRLGAGFFAQSFTRKLVVVDYHIAMGGRAYGTLAESVRGRTRGQALAAIFGELAAKFQRLVDVLNDVSEMAYTHTDKDVLRLYEIWLKTGSPRARMLLGKLGVEPCPVGPLNSSH